MLRGVPAREIVKRVRESIIAEYMLQHDLTDRNAALTAYMDSQPYNLRDFNISHQDIANIRLSTDRQTWRFAEQPQLSVRMWAQQNPDSLLYLDEQKPTEGTDDYAHLQELRQQAVEALRAKRASQGNAADLGKNPEAGQPADPEGDLPPDDPVEPAFAGADDSLDRPAEIDLNRPQPSAEDVLNFVGLDPKFPWDINNWDDFSIAILPPANITAALKWGKNRPLQLDSTFGCNAQKFPMFSIVAVDDSGRGIPLAFLITSREREELIQKFLKSFRDKVKC